MDQDALLALVERFARPHREAVTTRLDGADVVGVVIRPGLLEQIRDDPRPEVRQLRDEIHGALVALGSASGLPWRRVEDDDRTLVGWWRLYSEEIRAGNVSDTGWAAQVARLRGWAERIEALQHPPATNPISATCPRCGATLVGRRARSISALAIVRHDAGAEGVGRIDATCRACGHVWRGRTGLRWLLAELDDAARARERQAVADLRGIPPVGSDRPARGTGP